MADQKQRLQDALELVRKAMNSPNAFENAKESTFSSLRRGCLDLRKSIELLDADDFSNDLIRDAWLFLIELSKAKLRRKHAIECINIMLQSAKWGDVLRTDGTIQAKISGLTRDMQVALGYVERTSPAMSPAPAPSSAGIAPAGITRRPSGPLSLARSKSSKSKKNTSTKPSPTISPAPRIASIDEESVQSVLPDPGPHPVLEPLEPAAPKLLEDEETNPFRTDLNPFKDFRGLKQASNPYARAARGPTWWDQSSVPKSQVWWS